MLILSCLLFHLQDEALLLPKASAAVGSKKLVLKLEVREGMRMQYRQVDDMHAPHAVIITMSVPVCFGHVISVTAPCFHL